jgi:ATP-dependent DNA ligase
MDLALAPVKCLYREELVVVGWTDPEGRRPYLGALLLAYYDPDGRLVYAGRAGTGINQAELLRLWRRLQPLAIEHKGGVDSFLRNTPDRKLSPEIRRLKRLVERAAERNSG